MNVTQVKGPESSWEVELVPGLLVALGLSRLSHLGPLPLEQDTVSPVSPRTAGATNC